MFYFRIPSHHITIQSLVIFTMASSIFWSGNLISSTTAGSLKYTHNPLVSALRSGRSHDYSTGSGSGGTDVSDDDGGGNVNGAVTLDSEPVVGGGEILVPKSLPMNSKEPTCEQLRAMWIFSKRQSRAAEITNEIPTYRDPFAYNVWEPYYSSTRSLGAVRMVPRYKDRPRSPIFGRVISREPLLPRIFLGHQRQRHLAETAVRPPRFYSAGAKPTPSGSGAGGAQRRPMQYRYIGANGSNNGISSGSNSVTEVQGSFQKLKELIWTERSKELTQQRRAEEMAARAAVLKEIANGKIVHHSSHKHPFKSESALMDVNRSPDQDSFQPMNDDRISIASGQSKLYINKEDKPLLVSSTRSFVNKGSHGMHKPAIFSENAASTSGRSTRLLSPSMIASSYPLDESRELRDRSSSSNLGSIIGIPTTYPVRPSYFRERNRSLFKQNSGDYFQRNQRNSVRAEVDIKNVLLDHIIQELSRRHVLQKYNKATIPLTASFDNDDSGTANLLMGIIGNYDIDADDNADSDGDDTSTYPFLNDNSVNDVLMTPTSGIDLEQQLATELFDYSNFY